MPSSKIDTKDKIFSHKSNHASAQTLSEQLTRAKSPVPIFALSLIMWEELSSNFNDFCKRGIDPIANANLGDKGR